MSQPGYEGYADLGALMGGGGSAGNAAAYQKGAAGVLSLEDAMSKAKMSRQKAMEREQFRSKLPPGPEGDMVAALVLGEMGGQYNSAQLGVGHGQQNEMRARAMAMPLPSEQGYNVHDTPADLNAAMSVATGRALTPTTVDPGELSLEKVMTEQATRGARQAAANNSNAAAGAHHAAGMLSEARADLVRRTPAKTGKPPTKITEPVDGSLHPTAADADARIPRGDNAGAPPAKALKPGVVTTFKNGQRWTLENGKPKRMN